MFQNIKATVAWNLESHRPYNQRLILSFLRSSADFMFVSPNNHGLASPNLAVQI
jgi:hypothetical protein